VTGISKTAENTLHEIHDWAKHEGFTDRVEIKPTSIAFHVRGMAKEKASRLLDIVRGEWEEFITDKDLMLEKFDGGLEFRAAGVTKGDAVRSLLEETSQAAVVAYLGDDKTDEDAFAVLGDRGAKVLVRPQLRESQADIWITPPEELLDFLKRWNKAHG
jgi:trehalose 6-phosphate synthase/trehalose 6-phosphate phosphatase